MEREIDDATLGFAMIMVVAPHDASRGPTMLKRTINRRATNEAFLKRFARGVKENGLLNRSSKNAIMIGVRRTHIELDSLRPLKSGQYTNKVQWTANPNEEERTMVLYNGSHRIEYMTCLSSSADTLDQRDEVESQMRETTDKSVKEELSKKLDEILEELDENGVWLAKFLDIGERKTKTSGRTLISFHFIFSLSFFLSVFLSASPQTRYNGPRTRLS